MRERRVVCRADELEPGQVRLLDAGPWGIGVFNVGGRFHALANRCPHRHGPVCRGLVTGMPQGAGPDELEWVAEGEILRCPWHAWEFRIATGDSITGPGRRIPTYPVHVADGEVVVELREERSQP
jgi:nitrite reductase/ring-hydroxylating ferredoxin subunit